MKDRIVVIGSNSISGASFVKYALAQGCDVIGLSRSPEIAPVFLPYKWLTPTEQKGEYRFRQLDLNHHTDEIAAEVESSQAGYVVNFAAQSMVAESWLNPEHWYQTNVVANVRLHEKLRKFSFLKKYVHISTPEVYGSCSGDVTESQAFNPSTPYAASRAACDLHLLTYFKNYKFPVVFTRAANVYGPGQQLYRIIPRTVLYVLLKRKIQLHGGGHSVRSFIHLDDVSDATLRIAREGVSGQAYHLSTEERVSIRDLVARICERMGSTFDQSVEVVDDRPGKDAAYLLNSNRARTELGWSDKVSLDQGIDQVIDWVKANLADLQQQSFDYIHKP